MKVKDIMTGQPRTCSTGTNLAEATARMLDGIVSMNDIVLASGPRRRVREVEVVNTLQAICAHHHPSAHMTAA